MADISKDELRKEITGILKDADLTSMSAKKVRQQIEEKLDVDLTERKKEIDELVMECLQEKQDSPKKSSKKAKAASEESEDGEEEEEEEAEEEEEESSEEEPVKKPAKRGPKKGAPKRKKNSSEDEESASDEDASDEEYSPKKKPKKGKPGKKGRKSKGGSDDSDSDSDWGKNKKKSTGGAKKGGGGKGSGYTKAHKLSPELATVVGCKEMARYEVVKKIWAIIKEKNLFDPNNKQFAICDDDLFKVFGVKRFRTFGMMKYLKTHFVD